MSAASRLRMLAAAALVAATALVRPASADHRVGPREGAPPADWMPPQMQNIGITEHLGETIPLDVRLRDETGKTVVLRDFVTGQKPVMVNFVYHTCPTLCTFVQSGFASSIKDVPWAVGDKYDILTISIDPRDTPAIASEKKTKWVASYGRDPAVTARGWHFLTGDDAELQRLTKAVGFQYYFDEKMGQYAHSAALFVLTPSGKIARYLYGIEFPKADVRLALAEAAEGRSTSTVDHLLLYCYRYDPNSRGYVLVAWRVMRLGAGATVLGLGGLLAAMWLRERRKRRTSEEVVAPTLPSAEPPHVQGSAAR